MSELTEKRRRFIITAVYWVIIIGLIYVCFKYFLPLFMPFCLAVLFSLILQPLIRFLTNKCRIKGKISAIIALVLLFIVIVAIIFAIAARLVSWVADIANTLPGFYKSTIEPSLARLTADIETMADRFDPSIQKVIDNAIPQITTSIGEAVSKVAAFLVTWISGIAAKVPTIFLSCVMFSIGTIFITLDYKRITRFLKRQLPERAVNTVTSVKDHFFTIIFRYGKSYSLILLITFVEITAGLLIIGIDKAFLLGLIIAIFDIFPIVGAGMILVPWGIVNLIIGNTTVGISLVILYIVEIAVREIIEPKIVGQHVGLHPVATLIGMYVGTKLFGGLGLLGVPICLAIFKNLNLTGTFHVLKYDDPAPAAPKPPPEKKEE